MLRLSGPLKISETTTKSFFSGRIKSYLEEKTLETKNKLNRVRKVKTKRRKGSEEQNPGSTV